MSYSSRKSNVDDSKFARFVRTTTIVISILLEIDTICNCHDIRNAIVKDIDYTIVNDIVNDIDYTIVNDIVNDIDYIDNTIVIDIDYTIGNDIDNIIDNDTIGNYYDNAIYHYQ